MSRGRTQRRYKTPLTMERKRIKLKNNRLYNINVRCWGAPRFRKPTKEKLNQTWQSFVHSKEMQNKAFWESSLSSLDWVASKSKTHCTGFHCEQTIIHFIYFLHCFWRLSFVRAYVRIGTRSFGNYSHLQTNTFLTNHNMFYKKWTIMWGGGGGCVLNYFGAVFWPPQNPMLQSIPNGSKRAYKVLLDGFNGRGSWYTRREPQVAQTST